MIKVMIDNVSFAHGPKNRHRVRVYTLEIMKCLNMNDGSMGYSAWLTDELGREVDRVWLRDIAYPEVDVLKLVGLALAALKAGDNA